MPRRRCLWPLDARFRGHDDGEMGGELSGMLYTVRTVGYTERAMFSSMLKRAKNRKTPAGGAPVVAAC